MSNSDHRKLYPVAPIDVIKTFSSHFCIMFRLVSLTSAKKMSCLFVIRFQSYSILASVSFWPLLIIESVARVFQHVLFTHELLVKQV